MAEPSVPEGQAEGQEVPAAENEGRLFISIIRNTINRSGYCCAITNEFNL